MFGSSRRGLARRVGVPIVSTVALVVAATGCELSVDVPLTCNIVGPLFSQRIRSSITPDNLQRGGTVRVDLNVGWIAGRSEGTVREVELTLPLPLDLARVDQVTFDAGDLAGTWSVAGRQLVVRFTGAASEKTVQIPTMHVTGTVAADARGGEFPWRTLSSTAYVADHVDGVFESRCVPTDPATVINRSWVTG